MKTIILMLLPILICANILKLGESVTPLTLKSQHDKEYELTKDGIWIITWDKESTKVANSFFDKHKMAKNTNLIVDVSQAPSGIFNLFILPNMKRYTHPILLSYDENYNITLPYKKGYLTVLRVENKKIKSIEFIQSTQELKELFN